MAKKEKVKHSFRYWFRRVINSIMIYILFVGLMGCGIGASIIYTIISKSDVVLDTNDLNSTEASIVYDREGNQISLLGKENRINVDYNSLPQCVIDAFVAVEDSRYFEHSGFDLPRFVKAAMVNLKSLSFDQGGSTFTMQVIKNTYFLADAARGKSIDRKIKEIYYSLKITNLVSKEKLFEMYINKINFGASARGIQVASDYYFGKEASELNLVEACVLAGVINAPNYYNPYVHPSACQSRTGEVLYQMLNHGYITQEEYNLAKNVQVVNLLKGTESSRLGSGSTIKNQAYVDVVIQEIIDQYGIDPYVTPVKIYTGMDQNIQTYYDTYSNGEIQEFKDDYVNCASICIESDNSLIVGVCGGRDYDRQRKYNYATDARYGVGSNIKAFFIYPLAIEYLNNIATNSVIVDEPIYYAGTEIQVYDIDRTYIGEISLSCAFNRSLNIPSIKLYNMLVEKIGTTVMKDYLRSIEIDEKVVNNMNVQYALGQNGFDLSVFQVAGGMSSIMNSGQYTRPHTITRIEFINSTKEPIVCNYESTQVLSEGAAWIMKYLLRTNSDKSTSLARDSFNNPRSIVSRIKGVETYCKTGTSSIPEYYVNKYNMPTKEGAGKTYIACTNDYICCTWFGYDYSKYCDQNTYLDENHDKIPYPEADLTKAILLKSIESFGTPENNSYMPESVTLIENVYGYYPYKTLPSYSVSKYLEKGYALTKNVSYSEWELPTIHQLQNVIGTYKVIDTEEVTHIDEITGLEITETVPITPYQVIDIEFDEYPEPEKTIYADTYYEQPFGTMKDENGDVILDEQGNPVPKNVYKLKKAYSDSWIDGNILYHAVVYDQNDNIVTTIDSTTNVVRFKLPNPIYNSQTYRIVANYKYSIAPVASKTVTSYVVIDGSTFN